MLSKEREYFLENLSMLVSSGVGVADTLETMLLEIRSGRLKKIISGLKNDIEDGMPFSRSLSKTKLFGAHVISLIRIGEESGRLSENLKIVSAQEQKERAFRSKIRSAAMYPVIVLSLTAVVGVGVSWFMLPRLAAIFSELRIELPLVTKALIHGGVFLKTHGMIAMPLFFLGLVLFTFFLFFFRPTKFIGQALLSCFPGVRGLIQEIELARLGFILGTLLEADLPVTVALESVSRATVFSGYRRFYANLYESINEGNSFRKSFARDKCSPRFIPLHIQEMIVAGEQSGALSKTLLKIGENFESRIDTTTKNLAVIFEPVLLVIVWLGVVAVALAVILPIYNLIGGLNQ